MNPHSTTVLRISSDVTEIQSLLAQRRSGGIHRVRRVPGRRAEPQPLEARRRARHDFAFQAPKGAFSPLERSVLIAVAAVDNVVEDAPPLLDGWSRFRPAREGGRFEVRPFWLLGLGPFLRSDPLVEEVD